ncbi:MAG: hypothetical protein IJ086_00890 [Clostridium sp.]|nr:hypothetical protein [Clostridium sp.]
MDKVKFLIKINSIKQGTTEKLMKFIELNMNLISFNYISEYRVDGEAEDFNVEKLKDFCCKNNLEITLIYYSLTKKYAKKIEYKYRYISSIKSIFFNSSIESELFIGVGLGIKDFLFDTLNSVIELSEEQSLIPKIGDLVIVSNCNEEDILKWYKEQDARILKVININYKLGTVKIEGCNFDLSIEYIVKSNNPIFQI